MKPGVKRLLCHAFVAPRQVILNAVVTYNPGNMQLIDVVTFERETASTTHFDGIVVNGLPMDNVELRICSDGFRDQLSRIAELLVPSDKIILLPLTR